MPRGLRGCYDFQTTPTGSGKADLVKASLGILTKRGISKPDWAAMQSRVKTWVRHQVIFVLSKTIGIMADCGAFVRIDAFLESFPCHA